MREASFLYGDLNPGKLKRSFPIIVSGKSKPLGTDMEPNVHKCNDVDCTCQDLNLPPYNYARLSEGADRLFWIEDDAEIEPIDPSLEWRDAE